MTTYTSTQAQNKFGELLENAQRGPVAINRNGRVSAVVVSATEFAEMHAKLADLSSIQETDYLNSSPANQKVLAESIKQASKGSFYRTFSSIQEMTAAAERELGEKHGS